jgi:hypothetical protein
MDAAPTVGEAGEGRPPSCRLDNGSDGRSSTARLQQQQRASSASSPRQHPLLLHRKAVAGAAPRTCGGADACYRRPSIPPDPKESVRPRLARGNGVEWAQNPTFWGTKPMRVRAPTPSPKAHLAAGELHFDQNQSPAIHVSLEPPHRTPG